MNLTEQKILFLSANFFGYEKAIVKKLQECGAQVNFYNERPSDSLFSKGIIRVKSSIYQNKIDQYYRKIIKEIEDQKFDFFLLIKGESIPMFFLEIFRTKNPEAKMIFYSYDTVAEYPKFLKLHPYFDENFTFEPSDALNYELHFRPLFYIDEYLFSPDKKEITYDLAFIGSAHTDRYLIGEKVRKYADELKLKSYFYYYAPGRTAFALKKIFDKSMRQFDPKKLSFKKLSHANIAEIYNNSKAVLDINKPFQQGLTMRTFEALASGTKLMTTNSDIVNYPFYHSENIDVIERDYVDFKDGFFKSPFKKIDSETLEKLSLESWISCLFFQNQDEYWQKNHPTFKKK